MSHWTRRIFTSASFFLFASSAALCIRSYRVIDFVAHQHVNHSSAKLVWNERILVSGRGGICLVSRHSVWTLPHPDLSEREIASIQQGWSHDRLPGNSSDTFGMNRPPRFGFGAQKITNSNGVLAEGRIIVFPWAVPALMVMF